MNTFLKYSKEFPKFLKCIADTNPDYIVPVERKGCKLMRSQQEKYTASDLNTKIRYLQYFENNSIDLYGKRISIVDDATKFTSSLYEYRKYFEDKGATVSTYSYVGQQMLKTAEREQYDLKANIFQYLDESTYQEYIIQQSQFLAAEDEFFDIDHLIIRIKLTHQRYKDLLNDLNFRGEIICTNDVYTPLKLEKMSFYNFGFFEDVPFFSHSQVTIGSLKKLRLCYNFEENLLTIAPLAFPIWNSTLCDNRKELLHTFPGEVLYSIDTAAQSGMYMNICYIYHACLLKSLFQIVFPNFKEFRDFEIESKDLISYIGNENAERVIRSTKDFLFSRDINFSNFEEPSIKIEYKQVTPIASMMDLMNELRREYDSLITNTVLGKRYFISYEEIFGRYKGRSNLNKWIDILCDRGVLVARNIEEKGVFFRACRSGEGDYNHIEKKTELLIPIAINICGTRKNETSYIIPATYLNKVLANLAYDYPKDVYDFHAIFTKPYLYGPLTYVKNQLCNETDIPLYRTELISEYYKYDDKDKNFISISQNHFSDKITAFFSQNNAVPYSEISIYLDFLKEIQLVFGKADVLNTLVICRDEDIYYRHVHYDVASAMSDIRYAMKFKQPEKVERFLRDSAKLANAAITKLEYDINSVLAKLDSDLGTRPVYFIPYTRIRDSFIPFSKDFCTNRIPILKQIAVLEKALINLLLYNTIFDLKYLKQFINTYYKQTKFESKDILTIEMIADRKKVDKSDDTIDIISVISKTIDDLNSVLLSDFQSLPAPKDTDYVLAAKKRNLETANNIAYNYIQKYCTKEYVILHMNISGYRNLENKKSMDVISIFQTISSNYTASYDARIIYGTTGSDESVAVIFNSIESTLKYVANIYNYFSNIYELNQIKIKMGFSYQKKINEISKNDIYSVWKEAGRCCNYVSSRFININNLLTTSNSLMKFDESTKNELLNFFKQIDMDNRNEITKYYKYDEIGDPIDMEIIQHDKYSDDTVNIGIITALTEECAAMRSMMQNVKYHLFPGKGAGHEFYVGEIRGLNGKNHLVALAQTLGPGNETAATRSSKMLEHFPQIDAIIMTGIAGGTPDISTVDKHVRLGDIVISDSIFQYDFVKETFEEVRPRNNPPKPCARLIQAYQLLNQDAFENKKIWEKYIIQSELLPQFKRPSPDTDILQDESGCVIEHPIDGKRTNMPFIFYGKIATSNTLLKNPKKRNQLKEEHNVYAVEMEGAGIANATWEAGVGYFIIRGISDYCDGGKNDIWHNYASLVAAAYTRSLIEKLPTNL